MIPAALQTLVSAALPSARLELQPLPQAPEITLALLDHSYPQHRLDAEAIRHIMDNPLYWIFCWASGQVMARFILDNPNRVAGKTVLDFGAGSGVVGIAAALAGAARVIACDVDTEALAACRYNAACNGVTLTYLDDFDQLDTPVDVIVAADVLYDRSNLHWLDRFCQIAPEVLLADSRVRDFDVPPFERVANIASCTLPDLDESPEFRHVTVYQAVT